MEVLASPPGETPVIVEAILPASAARLFQAWTDPVALKQWFGADPTLIQSVEVDLCIGGYWKIEMSGRSGSLEWLEGHYTIIQPAERLAFTWQHNSRNTAGQKQSTPLSEVDLQFKSHGQATRLILEHRAIASEGGRIGVRDGWSKSMQHLAAYLRSV